MQRMTKLVQESSTSPRVRRAGFSAVGLVKFITTLTCGLTFSPLRSIHLTLEFGHPSTALFALAWEEIGIEHGKIAAIAVEYLVSLNVG